MKKWTYLAVAGMLLGSAPVFTGCVDTDEPWGVEQLRGAKAELLKAKAAVEQANAQWVLADATYREAIARWQNALALQAEYDAEAKRLENDIQAARNEKEKLDLQKQMEELQQKMEENALKHQTTMLQLQQNYETVKRQYELVMQAIEIAEAIGSEELSVTISSLKADVQKKYAILYGGNYTENGVTQTITLGESLYQILQDAQQLVYDISLNHAHGIINKVDYIPTLELEVERNQAKVDAAQEALTKLQEFLEKDTETTDWRAEIAALEESIDAIDKEMSAKFIELAKLKNSQSYLAASQALYGVYGPDKPVNGTTTAGVEGALATEYPTNWEDAAQNGAWQVYNQAVKDLYTLKVETEFELKGDKMETKVSDQLNDLLKAVEAQMGFSLPTDWQNIAYGDNTYRYYYTYNGQEYTPSFDIEKGEYPSTIKGDVDVKLIFEAFQHYKEVLAEATENNYQNAIEVAKAEKTRAEAELKTEQEEYNKAAAKWEIAVKAYQGEATDMTKSEEYKEIDAIFTAYNSNFTLLENAVKAYNEKRQTDYQAAFDKYIEEQTTAIKVNRGLTAPGLSQIDGKGFDLQGAQERWAEVDGDERTVSALEKIVREECSAYGTTSQAEMQALALGYIDAFVKTVTDQAATQNEAKRLGKEAADKVKKDDVNKYANAVRTSITSNLDNALAKLENLAANPYGQVLTKEAKAAFTVDNLIGAYDETAKKNVIKYDVNNVAICYTDELDKNGVATGNLVVAVTKIEDAEKTTVTKTALDADQAKVAWEAQSYAMFGLKDRIVPPTDEEILEANVTTSAGYQLVMAKQRVQNAENVINQVADLGKLKEEVDAAYDALVKKFQTEYDATFAEAEKAIDDAEAKLLSADAALMKEEEKLVGVKAELGKLEAQKNAEIAVKDQLIISVTAHLGIEWPVGSGVTGNYDPASFEEDLQNAVLAQKEILNSAQKLLSEAQIALEKAQDGQFDDLSYAQLQLNIAQYNFDQAWNAYQEALSNLEKGLAVIAEETPEEQPAE
ncbi:hypothetical protein EVD33_11935 [Bacteroidales bacterium SW292]|nr:hypothetical protein [Bacteroidales bacterium SW292]